MYGNGLSVKQVGRKQQGEAEVVPSSKVSAVREGFFVMQRPGGNNEKIALLQCTSHYPSTAKDANLYFMDTLKKAFNCVVGYSDHTMGINVSLASVAMGAKILEKHFTLQTNSFGVDHDASLSPKEMISLVSGVREVEASFGTSRKIIPPHGFVYY